MELPNKKYKVIYADPPWKYGNWGKANPKSRPNSKVYPMPYNTMNITEIKSLPIKSLAENNCELYLWTTQKYLPIAFQIIEFWEFKYCQTLRWCKKPRRYASVVEEIHIRHTKARTSIVHNVQFSYSR